MQYTGLKDSSNPPKEIYESDIVKADNRAYQVEWFDSQWVVKRNEMQRLQLNSVTLYSHEFEVIGNIYENKDLLGE